MRVVYEHIMKSRARKNQKSLSKLDTVSSSAGAKGEKYCRSELVLEYSY